MTMLVSILQQSVTTVFQENAWEVLNHSPYRPNLSSLDYDLFPKLTELLQGIRFSDLSELPKAVTQEIWRHKNHLLHRIERLPEHWQAWILWEGDYIEEL